MGYNVYVDGRWHCVGAGPAVQKQQCMELCDLLS